MIKYNECHTEPVECHTELVEVQIGSHDKDEDKAIHLGSIHY